MSGPKDRRPGSGRESQPAADAGPAHGLPAGSSGPTPAAAGSSLYERYKDALRRGHVAALRGRHDAAIDAYGEAASIAPDRALPHVSLGGILLKMDRLVEAAAAYQRASDLAPRDENAIRGLADVHVRAGRRTAAASALDRLADILDADGRLADATDAARRALELAESRDRRSQVESFASRLRAASGGDDAAQRALDQVLRLLEPGSEGEPAAAPAEAVADGSLVGPDDRRTEPGEATAAAADGPDTESDEASPPGAPAMAETTVEPVGLGIALGAAAEAALHAGDLVSAREGLLAAARAHRRAGRTGAAIDACYLAIGLVAVDADLHLLLAELYLDRGWRTQATEKLLLLGRLAELRGDASVRERLCALVTERLPDEPRVVALCA
ncbi:MAG TPA: hypothetical protein VFK35_05715 [Candidatus Limnocylindrales bacterium]|nr:hypothetical protein [Candidatus Limnocylindrales bacterium]